MRVFVTSASSFIGSAVVTQLIGADHHVTGLAVTRRLLDWETTHPGLLDDLDHGKFFEPMPG